MRPSSGQRWRAPLALWGVVLVVTGGVMYGAGAALIVRQSAGPADVLLVLGSHEWERLPAAAKLAALQPESAVWLTKPKHPTISNCHRCADRAEWLAELGVQAERVTVLPRRVSNTFDEAVAAREYASMHPVRTIVVVTSPYHTRRALAVFRTAFEGTNVSVGVSFDEFVAAPRKWWWRPYDRAYVAYEWAALAWYTVRHGVSPLVSDQPRTREGASAL
jgi:uncharacterized SAM-binding protein YcdF (DUF218 family)